MKTPEKIYHVSTSQFSIARYYGRVNFNGKLYIYDPRADTLTRDDIFIKEKKLKKEKIKEKRRVNHDK